MPQENSSLAQAVDQCAQSKELLQAIAEIYDRVAADTNDINATCLGGGACCKFDLMDHRLYVSTGELALLTTQPISNPRQVSKMRCPYQVGTRCTARQVRPLGCRIFFCQATMTDWCCQTYEKYHKEIQQLHKQDTFVYAYVELTAALGELSKAR